MSYNVQKTLIYVLFIFLIFYSFIRNMLSRTRKMIAMVCPPEDSGSDGENDDDALEIPSYEIDELMAMLDEDLEDCVSKYCASLNINTQ